MSKTMRLFLGIVFVGIIIASGGILVWEIFQRGVLKKEVEENRTMIQEVEQQVKVLEEHNVKKQQEISALEKEILSQRETEKGLQSIFDRLTGSQQKEYSLPLFKTEERFIEVINPSTQETLCLNQPYTIEWAWNGVKKVSIKMESGTAIYTIENTYVSEGVDAPDSKGIYQWRVGDVDFGFVRPEAWYKIRIFSFDGGVVTAATSASFLISSCKG